MLFVSCNDKNRRSELDRRHVDYKVSFPLRTNDNIIVSHDCRVRCDRRIQNLEVTESDISHEAFMDSFNALLKENNHSNNKVDSTTVHDTRDIDIYKSCFNYD